MFVPCRMSRLSVRDYFGIRNCLGYHSETIIARGGGHVLWSGQGQEGNAAARARVSRFSAASPVTLVNLWASQVSAAWKDTDTERRGAGGLSSPCRRVNLCFMEIKRGLHSSTSSHPPPSLPCLQMVPVERGWLSGPSEAGNLRVLMLGGQCSATPSLLSPGAWTWSPLPAAPPPPPLPHLWSPPPSFLLLYLSRLRPGTDFLPPTSHGVGIPECLDRWVLGRKVPSACVCVWGRAGRGRGGKTERGGFVMLNSW